MLNLDADDEFLDHCLPIHQITEYLQLNMGNFSRHTRHGVVVFEPLGNRDVSSISQVGPIHKATVISLQ